MMRRLLLINPAHMVDGARHAGPAQFPIPPLNLCYLAALTPRDWAVRMIDENLRLEDGRAWQPDLVGITALTPSAPRAYELAARYRDQGTAVVLGGIHASMMPKEAAQHADAVVVGEAESVWPLLVADFERDQLQPRYDGERVALSELPMPRRDLYPGRYFVETVITSKGCTNACEFCSVWRFSGRRHRVRPVDDVVDELATLPPRKLVFFADDNLTLNRCRVVSLCRRMVERGVRRRYAIQGTIGLGEDEELLTWLKRSGCSFVFVGIESLNERPPVEISKADLRRLGPEGCRRSIARIHEHGMAVFGSFILGLDGDSASARRILPFTLRSEIDCTLVNLLNPLPGTGLWDRMRRQGRLLYTDFPSDYAMYAQDNVCFRPLDITTHELQETARGVIAGLTDLPTALRRAASTWRHTRDPFTTLVAFNWNRRTARGLRTYPLRAIAEQPSTVVEAETMQAYAGSKISSGG